MAIQDIRGRSHGSHVCLNSARADLYLKGSELNPFYGVQCESLAMHHTSLHAASEKQQPKDYLHFRSLLSISTFEGKDLTQIVIFSGWQAWP